MSHQIDLTSDRLSKQCDGHRALSGIHWQQIFDRQSFLMCREPLSTHKRLIEENAFEFVTELKAFRFDDIGSFQLARSWEELADDDLNCSGVFIQAKRPMPTSDFAQSTPQTHSQL